MPERRNDRSAARIGREREDEPMRSSGQLGELEQIGLCPDCGRPVESHSMFKDGRCPVVRFEPRGVEMASESAARTDGYLTPWRHVDDLLEAAERLTMTAANTAALFDDDLEADCDAATRALRQARATALRDYQEQVPRV